MDEAGDCMSLELRGEVWAGVRNLIGISIWSKFKCHETEQNHKTPCLQLYCSISFCPFVPRCLYICWTDRALYCAQCDPCIFIDSHLSHDPDPTFSSEEVGKEKFGDLKMLRWTPF